MPAEPAANTVPSWAWWATLACGAAATASAARLYIEVLRQRRLVAAERSGRFKAEKRLVASASTAEGLSVVPIGVIGAPFADKNGTPRQPGLVQASVSTVKLFPKVGPTCLRGLGEFSHVYVLFWFHLNTNSGKDAAEVKKVVTPPRGKGLRVGVLACRTPHRPNPIGLSLVPVVSVDERAGVVVVKGLDCVDGTPLLDLKPYIPSVERPATFRCPAWVDESYEEEGWTQYSVEFAPGVQDSLENMASPSLLNACDGRSVSRVAAETLRTDFRNERHRRLEQFDGSLRLQNLEIRYTLNGPEGWIRVTGAEERGKT